MWNPGGTVKCAGTLQLSNHKHGGWRAMFASVCRRRVSDAVPQPTAGICKP